MDKIETIKIDSGIKRLQIQVDDQEPHIVSFNPNDSLFATKLHQLYFDAKSKLKEITALEEAQQAPELDENGMPINIDEAMENNRELNEWFREKIDGLFGEGTSVKIYGDTIFTGDRVQVYLDLISGVAKVVGPARAEKVTKYVKRK